MTLERDDKYTNPGRQWYNYYQTYGFGLPYFMDIRERSYLQAVENLQLPSLNEKTPLTFVLGGFFPHPHVPKYFEKFCRQIRKNSGVKDHYIFLDMNTNPFQDIVWDGQSRVQAELDRLPFTSSSIDFLFMDFTIDFMSDEKIRTFAEDVSQALTKTGLIIACWTETDIVLHKDFDCFTGIVDNSGRTFEEIEDLLNPLKIISYRNDDFSFFIATRKDSPWPPYSSSQPNSK